MFNRLKDHMQRMDPIQRRMTFVIIGIICFVLLYLFSYSMGFFQSGLPMFFKFKESVPRKEELKKMTSRNAFDIALLEARKWHPDAVLSFMNSGPVTTGGRSDVWKLIFSSPRITGKGYAVDISDHKITSASEIAYTDTGADFPVDIISSEEAIKTVRAIAGYENVEIYGVEMVYMGDAWYWGVKTSRGVVSVKTK